MRPCSNTNRSICRTQCFFYVLEAVRINKDGEFSFTGAEVLEFGVGLECYFPFVLCRARKALKALIGTNVLGKWTQWNIWFLIAAPSTQFSFHFPRWSDLVAADLLNFSFLFLKYTELLQVIRVISNES